MFRGITLKNVLISLFASAFLAFGLYNVHAVSGVTEGGVLGATLLLQHWFAISPALSNAVLNALCYLFGTKTLGRKFVIYSIVSTVGFSVMYAVLEQFPPLYPALYEMPLLAALLGALFVGFGAGFCVRAGGAPSGDDALAMGLSHLLGKKIETIYLVSDFTVLLLSLSYIPWQRIGWSLLTVVLSGRIIGVVQRFGREEPK
ncbi:MAG: YitT family protein [Oscillospiraceae bacterium]|nr:YitT family protein [Oscillospiraceae bacterium]